MRSLEIFGFEVCALPAVDVVAHCIALALSRRSETSVGQPVLVMALNPEKVERASRNAAITRYLRQADVLVPDGIGICLAARILHGVSLKRVTGCDLMQALCAAAADRGARVFVYGARPEINEKACQELTRRNPSLRIAGRLDGYAPLSGPGSAVERITEMKPDLVFVGLGTPRQERWMTEFGAALPVGLIQGIGGSLDVLAGATRRAPPTCQALGLEWLYRLLTDPSRWRRQLALVRFVGHVARLKLGPGTLQ